MSTEQTEKPQEKKPTPYEFLAKFVNAPTAEQVETWKQHAPGGRIKLFTVKSGDRVYIMRGVNAQELAKLQEGLLKTIPPERVIEQTQIELSVRCCLWTSTTTSNKLTTLDIQAAGAGLSDVLYQIVSDLSDYMNPQEIEEYSAEL